MKVKYVCVIESSIPREDIEPDCRIIILAAEGESYSANHSHISKDSPSKHVSGSEIHVPLKSPRLVVALIGSKIPPEFTTRSRHVEQCPCQVKLVEFESQYNFKSKKIRILSTLHFITKWRPEYRDNFKVQLCKLN